MYKVDDVQVNIEKKFRNGVFLDENDRLSIKIIVLNSSDISTLESLIYIYGRCFGFDHDVAALAKKYVFDTPEPGLTAVCLRVLVLFWNIKDDNLVDKMKDYLDYARYEEWYDEVVFCVNFLRKMEKSDEKIHEKIGTLIDDARIHGDLDLIKIITS